MPRDLSVLEMSSTQARAFFLKQENYCGIELPVYFRFDPILASVAKALSGQQLSDLSSNPRNHDGVNYTFLSNKDGRHAWRPFQLIHPALYVSLVGGLTAAAQWKVIRDRLRTFHSLPNFKCLSVPLQAAARSTNKAAQILNWWQGIEQASIELALEYNYVVHADIADCYAQIYTHSIAWALHGKAFAKANRGDRSLIGNVIDSHIQNMRNGQTNGIPQGSALMDFIAEIVLGYADLELSQTLAALGVSEFQILRYRDDYRIFVQNPQHGEAILKALTEVLIDLGLKLNSSKTAASSTVIRQSVKADKRAWLRSKQSERDLQKHLLIIHAHGEDYPNSGSLVRALTEFHEKLSKASRVQNPRALISIVVDIAYHSPRAFPVCAAIVSYLLRKIGTKKERVALIGLIHDRLAQLPNTGHMEVWFQRISHSIEPHLGYAELLCKLVSGQPVSPWNNSWITSNALKAALDPAQLINTAKLKSVASMIRPVEIRVFSLNGY